MVSLSLPLGDKGLEKKNGSQSLPISQRVPTGGPDSPAEQKPQNLGQDLLGLAGQCSWGGAGQGVGDEGKGIVRRAVSLGDGLPVRHEEFGADGRGRDAAPLQEDAVEHTAR